MKHSFRLQHSSQTGRLEVLAFDYQRSLITPAYEASWKEGFKSDAFMLDENNDTSTQVDHEDIPPAVYRRMLEEIEQVQSEILEIALTHQKIS